MLRDIARYEINYILKKYKLDTNKAEDKNELRVINDLKKAIYQEAISTLNQIVTEYSNSDYLLESALNIAEIFIKNHQKIQKKRLHRKNGKCHERWIFFEIRGLYLNEPFLVKIWVILVRIFGIISPNIITNNCVTIRQEYAHYGFESIKI